MRRHRRFAALLAILVCLGLIMLPQPTSADTLLHLTVVDPDAKVITAAPTTGVPLSGTVSDVTAGPNQNLGVIRVSGAQSVLANPITGRRIMAVLPLGTAYTKQATAETYQKYFSCPAEASGKKNALQNSGMRFVESTPRSITLEIYEMNPNGEAAALDFTFNQAELSTLRIARLADNLLFFRARPDVPVTRLEYCRSLYDVTIPFNNSLTEQKPIEKLTDRFTDVKTLSDADQAKLKILVDYGILSGEPDHKLRPNQYITRTEAFVLLGKAVPPTTRVAKTREKLPAWAAQPIGNLIRWGILNGDEKGGYALNQLITRSESLIVFQKALETYSQEP